MKKKIEKSITSAMDVIGGKWKTNIIAVLMGGGQRFNELMRTISGVTQRSLITALRELEENGLVHKVKIDKSGVYAYELTAVGKALNKVIEELDKWVKLELSDTIE